MPESEAEAEARQHEAELDRMLTEPEVLAITGRSKSSQKRDEERGESPKRFKPWKGSEAVRWWESEHRENQRRIKADQARDAQERTEKERQRPRDKGRFAAAAAE